MYFPFKSVQQINEALFHGLVNSRMYTIDSMGVHCSKCILNVGLGFCHSHKTENAERNMCAQ